MARPRAFALCLLTVSSVLSVSGPPAARAEGPPATPPTPQEQAMQGLELVLKGLRGMIEQVPLYGPPELLPSGDIILRRISPAPVQPPATPGASAGPSPPAQRM